MAQGDHFLDLGDGRERKLNLSKIKHLLELEERCEAGAMVILTRLRNSEWGIRDLREIVRLGLIGGGTAPEMAPEIIRQNFESNWFAAVPVAIVTLTYGLSGVPKDAPPGKAEADRAPAEEIASSAANS